jgi:hypothetical protein
MHLTMGGPVPEPLLAKISEILAANTMRRTHESPGVCMLCVCAVLGVYVFECTRVYAQISLQKILHIHRIYMELANPTHL